MIDFQVALDVATSISIIVAAFGYLKKLRESKRDEIMGIVIDTATKLRKAYREYEFGSIVAEILQTEDVNKFNESIRKFKLRSLDMLRMLEDILYFHIPRLQKYGSDEKLNEFISFLEEKRKTLEGKLDKLAKTELPFEYGNILREIFLCLEDLNKELLIRVNELLRVYIK